MELNRQKAIEDSIYIAKWSNETERYVKYDGFKDDYLKVNLNEAQAFKTKEDAENFVDEVYDFGYDKPEIVHVEVKTMA